MKNTLTSKVCASAIVLALAAPAMAAQCVGSHANLGALGAVPMKFTAQCFRTFGSPDGGFTSHYSFSVSTVGDLTGNLANTLIFKSNDVNFSSVALSGAGYRGIDTDASDGFRFGGLSAGTYDLTVSGYLDRFQSRGGYTGAVSATSFAAPVPEPETYGMALLGLAGVGLVVRRRRGKA